MNKTIKYLVYGFTFMLLLASCQKEETITPQKEVEQFIVGKWKRIKLDGKETVTNMRQIATFKNNGIMYSTTTYTATGKSIWETRSPFTYECHDNGIRSFCYYDYDEGKLRSELNFIVEKIGYKRLCLRLFRHYTDSAYHESNTTIEYERVLIDYVEDIVGLWKGIAMTGDATYGDFNHCIEFRPDGTYTYLNYEDGKWVQSPDVDNEYIVDGDYLACKWRPDIDSEFQYERWDIEEIKDGIMVWSAIREKEDGSRFTTTFTWEKVTGKL